MQINAFRYSDTGEILVAVNSRGMLFIVVDCLVVQSQLQWGPRDVTSKLPYCPANSYQASAALQWPWLRSGIFDQCIAGHVRI